MLSAVPVDSVPLVWCGLNCTDMLSSVSLFGTECRVQCSLRVQSTECRVHCRTEHIVQSVFEHRVQSALPNYRVKSTVL
mgnify:CR=1 FL=1